jgi:hypothetical protein
MNEFKHEEEERLSRQQTAERLIDIAYALTAGGPLEFSAAGRRITVPVANELRLGRAEVQRRSARARAGADVVDAGRVASAAHRSGCD